MRFGEATNMNLGPGDNSGATFEQDLDVLYRPQEEQEKKVEEEEEQEQEEL
jgi:hypothetical protein